MITETNHQMYSKLKNDLQLQEFGCISGEEARKIKEGLHLEEMDLLGLRNLRDFVVASTDIDRNSPLHDRDLDFMSATTCVIDGEISRRGFEV